MAKPTFRALAALPHEAMVAQMRQPEVKARIFAEENVATEFPGKMENVIVSAALPPEQTYALKPDSSYEPTRDESFAALAAKAGYDDPQSYLYDYLVAGDGRA